MAQVKEVKGPGGPRGMGPKPKVENPGKLLRRIMDEVFRNYLPHCILVLICIVVSALANVQASLFLQTLMDDYIVPMTHQQNPSFAPLAGALLRVGCIYLVGILAAWINARVMVNVTQGTLRNLRTKLFTHMESLPISYFDTHPHGDIMSVYTNDVDTLRQMISQSIPQLVSSVITIVSVFFSMCMLSWQLTIVTMLMVALMLFCSKKIAASSGKYFIQQQRDLGKLNGYIEEMMEGQKVVKVFTHEQKALDGFRQLNDQLKDSANKANSFANIMMPVNAQLGNISYAVCALAGAAMAVSGMGGTTLGTVVAFLSLNKGFNMPISQVSMQANSVIMALAGAERIFKMMDEPSETDEGYVTLVNAKYDRNDQLVETDERTGLWAWKHPHHDGTTTYHKLEGDITFTDVDFGYLPDKTVLHDINLYGRPGQKIAFVGSTGAGKTTITNLINRFYDIQDGKIRYDGINIHKIKKADLRRSLGIVLQDTHLFTGTVMENIRYGRLEATDEECIAAARLANADGFIKRLPDGYNTMLTNDGANLSQGQRQLLAILCRHNMLIYGSKHLYTITNAVNIRRTDEGHRYLAQLAEFSLGKKAAQLSAVGITLHSNRHGCQMYLAVVRQLFRQQNHTRAGCQYRQTLRYFFLQRCKHTKLMQQLALHRTFAARQDDAVQGLLQIRQLTQLYSLHAQLTQGLHVLNKCTLQC